MTELITNDWVQAQFSHLRKFTSPPIWSHGWNVPTDAVCYWIHFYGSNRLKWLHLTQKHSAVHVRRGRAACRNNGLPSEVMAKTARLQRGKHVTFIMNVEAFTARLRWGDGNWSTVTSELNCLLCDWLHLKWRWESQHRPNDREYLERRIGGVLITFSAHAIQQRIPVPCFECGYISGTNDWQIATMQVILQIPEHALTVVTLRQGSTIRDGKQSSASVHLAQEVPPPNPAHWAQYGVLLYNVFGTCLSSPCSPLMARVTWLFPLSAILVFAFVLCLYRTAPVAW